MPNRYGLGLFEALNIVAYAQFFGINDYSVESQCRASGVTLQDMTALVQWVNDYPRRTHQFLRTIIYDDIIGKTCATR